VYRKQIALPGPGGYQIRTVVADGLADRFGSAMQFIDIPEVSKGAFALTSLALRPDSSDVRDDYDAAALRVFKPESTIAFTYGICNATEGAAKERRVQTVVRIYFSGRTVYEGKPTTVDFALPLIAIPGVKGALRLGSDLYAAEYVMEVEARDMLAPGPPKVATQSMTFQVRE
jgi:hypothetical protein